MLLGIAQVVSEAMVELPYSIREELVEALDEMLDGYSSDPDAEAVVAYLLEQLEELGEEEGLDDLVAELEEESSLESPLSEVLEGEMTSNAEFEYTGEEVVSLLERICEIEWDEEDEDEDEDDDDDDDDDDEDEDEIEW